MGFWDSFEAGFHGSAAVDYYAQQTRDGVRRLRADLAQSRNEIAAPFALGMLNGQAILEEVESDLNAIQRASGDLARLKPEAIARKDELQLAGKELFAICRDPAVNGVPGLAEALLKANLAIRGFAKACNLWATDQPVRARIQWDVSMQSWNVAGDLLDEIAARSR